MNPLPCIFERALLCQAAVCEAARKVAIAEREFLACGDPVARVACGELLALLRKNSAFALKVKTTQRILPHAMNMKIQCGGLIGLRDVIDPQATAPNVIALIKRARAEYGALDALPFSRIIQGVAHWQTRPRRTPKP
ncbi:MAG: hypothetical protein N2441_07290 [Rhodocyclaceae bacterium]|nr:hypothetical protein [Rhodocyclaceae bacterium]